MASQQTQSAQFLSQVVGLQEIIVLFDHLDGVTFFLKDVFGKFMAFGDGAKRCLDFGQPSEVVGLTDYDLYPKLIADRITADDEAIIQTDTPMLNIVELLVNPRRAVIDWYVTNKCPVHDRKGRVIGIVGTVQRYDGRRKYLLEGTQIDGVVELIRKQPAANHRMEELADQAGMSTRQLGRRFHELLGMSPRDFIMGCRIAMACRALALSDKSVASISMDIGFYDQSAFAHHFRKSIGLSPLEYRRLYFANNLEKHL